jgi:hypothetical protein
VRAEVSVSESVLEVAKGAEGMEERHDAGIAEAEARGALPGFQTGSLEAVQGVLGEGAVVADALDLEELAVDLVSDGAQVVEVLQGLGSAEVARGMSRSLLRMPSSGGVES